MRRPIALAASLAVATGVLAGALAAPFAGASSHREAPAISSDPAADGPPGRRPRAPGRGRPGIASRRRAHQYSVNHFHGTIGSHLLDTVCAS